MRTHIKGFIYSQYLGLKHKNNFLWPFGSWHFLNMIYPEKFIILIITLTLIFDEAPLIEYPFC